MAASLCRATPARAQTASGSGKILAGYCKEWSIYYANHNLADLESNGSAAKLSHLMYASQTFRQAPRPATDTCAIADAFADFEDNNLPPLSALAAQGYETNFDWNRLAVSLYTRSATPSTPTTIGT